MNPRTRPLILALLVTLALLGAWRWHAMNRQAVEARKAAWLQYLQGPLADLLYGSTRIAPLMAKKNLSKQDRADLTDALAHLSASSRSAKVLAILVDSDPASHFIADVAPWHEEIYGLFEPWRNMVGRPLAKQALGLLPTFLYKVWGLLDQQRAVILQDKSLEKDDILEMNAMLYSLKEAAQGPANPSGRCALLFTLCYFSAATFALG